MNKIICIANQKGGVGKTTTSAAIALGMAAEGLKVCVLTIDPADHNPKDKDAVILECKDGKAKFYKKVRPE